MKKRNTQIALGLCAVVLVAVFAVSCSNSFEPAWKASDGKTTLSIRLGNPAAPSASSRLVVQHGGYLYIQTGHDAGTAILYGPWKVSAGDTFTTNDIPAGTYSAMHLIYTAKPLPDAGPIILASPLMSFTIALRTYLDDFMMPLDSVSLATIPDVTIIEGTTNVLKATLLPATTRTIDASGPLPVPHYFEDSIDARERLFIQLTNTSTGIGDYERLASLHVQILNADNEQATLFNAALYRADGSFVSAMPVSPSTIAAEAYNDINLSYAGANPGSLFLYVEYQGSDLQISALNRIKQELPQYEYYVSGGGGDNGRTAATPCTLQDAISSIADNANITAATPARIYLTGNISVAPAAAYTISRPTILTSAAGGPFDITIGATINTSLFLVHNSTENATLTIENLTIVGGSSIRALSGLVLVERGTCILGNNATLQGNWSQEDGYGGAVTVNNTASTFVMNSGATIIYCHGPYGGGVRLNAGEFRMAGGVISECWSYNDGGGIYVLDGMLRIEGGSIERNYTGTTGYGGGVCMDGGTCLMTGGFIGQDTNGNQALLGAGVYIHHAYFSFIGGKIWHNNTYTNDAACGAGVYVYGESLQTTFVMPTGSTGQIASNEVYRESPAGDFGGGGISVFGASAQVNLYGGVIGGATPAEGNTTNDYANGGGVYIYGGTVALRGTTIQNNTGTYGGGIYISDYGTLVLMSGIPAGSIRNNRTSYDGGGLYRTLNATLDIQAGVSLDTVIQDNTSDNDPATNNYNDPA